MISHGLTKRFEGIESFDFVLFESTKKREQDLLGFLKRMITQFSRACQLYLKTERKNFTNFFWWLRKKEKTSPISLVVKIKCRDSD
jgi:hypothetical protein